MDFDHVLRIIQLYVHRDDEAHRDFDKLARAGQWGRLDPDASAGRREPDEGRLSQVDGARPHAPPRHKGGPVELLLSALFYRGDYQVRRCPAKGGRVEIVTRERGQVPRR